MFDTLDFYVFKLVVVKSKYDKLVALRVTGTVLDYNWKENQSSCQTREVRNLWNKPEQSEVKADSQMLHGLLDRLTVCPTREEGI